MTFVQPAFALLLTLCCLLAWTARSRSIVNPALLAASYLFYGWVHPWFCALLALSTLIDYAAARIITERPAWRDAALWASVGGNLGVLGLFKYFDFFMTEFGRALTAVGLPLEPALLGLALPVGISFYTFQSMSYTLDVHRGRLPACASLVDFALYVAFFPQLVAGPIERATHLLPQVQSDRAVTIDQVATGVTLLAWGAFQKVCIGDVVGAYVDQVGALREPAGALIWASAIGFGTQIVADFSGYTDMARGAARMLGFELVKNFHFPYLATSTPDFWRRWHMSLSEWIRDYVYEPWLRLGRPSLRRTIGVTLGTFLLVGLWHGPRWTFILLGLWHGTAMVAYTVITPILPRRLRDLPGGRWFAIALHHALVLVPGGVLFREPDAARGLAWLVTPPWQGDPAERLAAAYILLVTVWVSLPLIAWPYARRAALSRLRGSPWIWSLRAALWTLALLAVVTWSSTAPDDFIYFQF